MVELAEIHQNPVTSSSSSSFDCEKQRFAGDNYRVTQQPKRAEETDRVYGTTSSRFELAPAMNSSTNIMCGDLLQCLCWCCILTADNNNSDCNCCSHGCCDCHCGGCDNCDCGGCDNCDCGGCDNCDCGGCNC